MNTRIVRIAAALLVLAPLAAHAHELRPALLELAQRSATDYDVTWRVPARGEMRLALALALPPDCTDLGPRRARPVAAMAVEEWRTRCPHGLEGATIGIVGLENTLTDVLVRVTLADGREQTSRVVASAPRLTIAPTPGRAAVARTYLRLGIEHILFGVDHLLFVLALLLLVHGGRRIVGTVTAFTVAHSLTLAAATLGFVHVPGPPVEATIALSIVFVAREIVLASCGREGLTERQPWLVAFTFGLLHGLGFAGALAQVGLPEQAIPVALLFFNVGVEIGQLLFIGAVLAATTLVARWLPAPTSAWHRIPPYAIGATASFWLLQRVAAFWS